MSYLLTIVLPILLTQLARGRYPDLPKLALPWISAAIAGVTTQIPPQVLAGAQGDPVQAAMMGLSASGLYSGGGKALMGWIASAIKTQAKK